MTAWEIAAAILVPLLGIISSLLGVKWRKGMKLLKEGSEAVVALGLCGLSMQKALEDPNISPGGEKRAGGCRQEGWERVQRGDHRSDRPVQSQPLAKASRPWRLTPFSCRWKITVVAQFIEPQRKVQ